MRLLVILVFTYSILQAQYLDSKSCGECHEEIYAEHAKSMHHHASLFKDAVHKKVAEITTPDKYSCALCHMPSTANLAGMLRGMHQPDPKDVRHQDGVSCFYCHQISDIYHAKAYNINFSSYHEGEKPTFFGNLDNPDSSDRHKSSNNELYKNSEVCMGCHSHKENSHGLEVCNSRDQYDKTSDCIGCHMPKRAGNLEKFNKRGRDEYASHEFLGIHSEAMVHKAVKLGLKQTPTGVTLEVVNKMGHPIITQPMRLKFVRTVVTREGTVIWSNFKESPLEDKEATFVVIFKDKEGKATMPGSAHGFMRRQNLEAMSSKTVGYKIPDLKEDDVVTSTWTSYIIAPKIAKKLDITDKETIRPYHGEEVSITIR